MIKTNKSLSQKGFTLIELLVSILIISIIAVIAYVNLFPFIYRVKLNQETVVVKQFIQEAQNYAKAKSANVKLVFSASEVKILSASGEEINKTTFDENIRYNATGSKLVGSELVFNFKGSPILNDGEPANFSEDDGKISLCYVPTPTSDCKYSKEINVAPITGVVKTD